MKMNKENLVHYTGPSIPMLITGGGLEKQLRWIMRKKIHLVILQDFGHTGLNYLLH